MMFGYEGFCGGQAYGGDFVVVGSDYFIWWMVSASVIAPTLASERKRKLEGLVVHRDEELWFRISLGVRRELRGNGQ